jgi:NADPH:quinone reductase-like Zn-dependent oxidoreductase
LVNGAGGGVGTFAVQIAKSFGAEVTAVTNTENLDLVRSIGADHVIDYTKEDFTKNGQTYDLICDIASNHSISDYKRIMNPNGTFVVVGWKDKIIMRLLYFAIRRPFASRGDKKFVFFIAKSNQEDLVTLKELMEAGKIVPVIDRRYTLSETAQAIKHLEEGNVRGKVIITMDDNGSNIPSRREWSR